MKSTEVQNPRRIPHISVVWRSCLRQTNISVRAYTTTHERKLVHAPFSFASACVCACGYIVHGVRAPVYTRWCLFSLQHGLAASVGIFRDKAGCYVVENRWITSGAAFCVEGRR